MTSRLRHRASRTYRSLTADLEALGWNLDYRQSSQLARTLEALIGELAALAELADGNKSTPTDIEGRYRQIHSPIPAFDAAEAQRRLEDAEKRLWKEYEKLAGVVRRPYRTPKPKCGECGRRERLVDEYCGPCGAAILKTHRR